MTGAAILARIQATVIHVEFTVLALEALCTVTLVEADEVPAGGAVLTRSRVTLVDFSLAVATGITLVTQTRVTIADVLAGTIITEPSLLYTLSERSVLARNHLHIANLTRPPR